MFTKILMVCVGNICRSPTAEVLLRHRLGERGVRVQSAGLAALRGSPIDPTAREILESQGLPAEGHVARQIDASLIDACDLVLAMEGRHVRAIHKIAPHARGKTFLLGKWQDDAPIPDPYRQDRAVFEHAYRMIDAAVESWRSYL
ncbi:low molecular weight protein-tyrosine-phosphatase [Luteimonas aquatica]|uniref:low molecular weight protein-tyrosine-phosphatase n=1 Tax=Luteimonas aquatica TaxID=450364 RepID=UPI001F583D5D|nr:low molecular weight protein-tyrosine-phosphatase [Luteimonas aquatica]